MKAITIIGAGVLAGAAQFALATPSFADAYGHASCIGIEASSISPPGSEAEFAGGMAELQSFVHSLAAELGAPPGAVVQSVAKLHEGSHEACDEVTE